MTSQSPLPERRSESVVAEIWSEVLELPHVGLQDNFFDLGGHSLLLSVVRERIALRLGKDVSLVELFAHPTVRDLARYLDEGSTGAATRAAVKPRTRGRAQLADRRAAFRGGTSD
ncbi:phosphopantetheine-binding protein [Streptomyces sp. ISL-94]|uniref:phosphopantetheine-binding protein n=1 Tax=Streptomyces sp. ISL-94 TaxID=2819190 RepID=UPI001BEADB12|nr:phosphopantetheine-binding protein [Streptomyces sp. ISL-94]MBT2481609.1 hypothetical protein [Streptomyces sp. ISL-94]